MVENIQQFEFDVFVSYASPDDELLAPFDRWVTRFVDGLRRTLRSKLTREPSIYFDQNTAEPNQEWAHIEACCRRSRLFVAIHSPSYVAREWPCRELELFVAQASDPERLFVVETTPVGAAAHPATQKRSLKRFFDPHSASGARQPMPIEPDTREFALRMWDLAGAIDKQLRRMKEDGAGAPAARPDLGPVLLAHTTDDLDEDREAVRRYLEQFGIEVLPHAEYSLGGAAFRQAFAEDLARSKAMVQLLGPRPGPHPPDLPEGHVRHQYEAAKSADVSILQWRSAALSMEGVGDPAHRAMLLGETVTASTLEQFKADIRARIETPPAPPAAPEAPVGSKAARIVFVNAERSDAQIAQRMKEELGQDYTVLIPLYDVKGSNRKDFRKKLTLCNAFLVVYGRAEPSWIDDMMVHAITIRRGHMPYGAICRGPPPHKPNVSFRIPGIREIDCTAPGSDEWQLDPVKELMAQLSC